MELSGKIAVVTGAGSGLGSACATSLVRTGVTVYGIARNVGKLHVLKKRLGENFIPVPLDIKDEKAVARWTQSVFSADHSPAILINNAGTGRFGAIDKLTTDQWHEMIGTNLTGTFFVTRNVVPYMKSGAAPAHIINIGSVLGKTTRTEASAYCASKFGLAGFTDALSKELRYAGIKVTCVNPGSIATSFFRQSGIEPHPNMLQPDDLAHLIVHILETPDNFLVDEVTVRPLDPNPPLPGV